MSGVASDRRLARCALWLALVLGCAARPMPAELRAEREDLGSSVFASLIDERARLLGIEYRLNRAATRSCGALVRPQFGVLAGSVGSLSEAWLREASARRRILGEALTIVYVVPASPFQRAGLRVGDELLSVNGESPRSQNELHALRMRTTDDSPTRVRYRRDGQEREIEVESELACPVTFSLADSESLVTIDHPAHVLVPRGLLAFTQDDHVLAIALAHGFAHAAWDDPDASQLERESKADRLGIWLAAHAGFDVGAAIGYWEDVARVHPWLVLPVPQKRREWRGDELDLFFEMLTASSHAGIALRMDGIRRAAGSARAGAEPGG